MTFHNINEDGVMLNADQWCGSYDPQTLRVSAKTESALSPYLFLILMDVLTEGVRKEVPESMMFADDIVLCGGREVDMTEYLDTWRKSLCLW